jgi:hypothetical protein
MINIFKYIINKKDKAQMNEKGQSDTVFEVLIAVILLGFVLLAGTLAMSSLSNTKCSKSIDITMTELKLKLEAAASSTLLSTDFLFNMPYCFGNDFTLALEKVSSAPLCSTYCPGSSGQCYLLDYYNKKDKVNQVRYVCVQISPLIQINGTTGDSECISNDPDYDTIFQVNLGSRLGSQGLLFTNGRYKISTKNLSTSNNNSSNICVFKRSSQ